MADPILSIRDLKVEVDIGGRSLSVLDGVSLAKRSGTAASLTESTRDCMFRLKQPGIMAMFAKRTTSSASSLVANGSADGLKAARSESNGVAASAAIAKKTTAPAVDIVEVSESD